MLESNQIEIKKNKNKMIIKQKIRFIILNRRNAFKMLKNIFYQLSNCKIYKSE